VPGLGDLPPELSEVDTGGLRTDRDVDRHLLVWAAIYQRSRTGGTTDGLMAELRRAVACLPSSPDDYTASDVRTATDAAVFLGENDLDESDRVLDLVAPAAARLAGVRPQLQAELEHRRIQHAISRGSFEDALAMIDAAEEFSSRHGLVSAMGWHRFARARIALERGDYESAATLLRERTADDLVAPALGALLNGDPAAAVAMLGELELSAEPDAPLRQIEVELQPHLVTSHAYEHVGDRDRAAAEARRELEIRRRYGPAPSLAEALCRVASFVPVREGVGLLEEAVALADSTPRRPVQARMLAAYGAALRQVGRIPQAREVLFRAADLASEMGMERRFARVQRELLLAGSRPRRARVTGPTSLTEAQREVAALAADGLTNRQIAERLFVTIKTVETHLMAVYRKLGIKARDQLAGALLASVDEAAGSVG
jgi:DNA-binding CsgD family transcriptional regulator